MRSPKETRHPATPTLVTQLRWTALVALLTLGTIAADACSRLEVSPPTVERSTPVAANEFGTEPSSIPLASPSPEGSAAHPSPETAVVAAPGTLSAVYPELRSLAAAPAFTITDEWSAGLIPYGSGSARMYGSGSVKLQYTLTRTQTGFDGLGGGGVSFGRAERRIERRVQVPTVAAEGFLRDLATVQIADRPYWRNSPIDASYFVEFAISADAGPVRIYRHAYQGRDGGVPWGAEYGGRQMVIDSAAPGQAYQLSAAPWLAYQLIRAYLDEIRTITQYELDAMIRAQAASPSLRPVP